MAESGSSTEEIQRQGRWSSEAWLRYTKRNRSINTASQIKISREVSARLKRTAS